MAELTMVVPGNQQYFRRRDQAKDLSKQLFEAEVDKFDLPPDMAAKVKASGTTTRFEPGSRDPHAPFTVKMAQKNP